VLVEQVEAELEVLGALVGEKAVERVVEHHMPLVLQTPPPPGSHRCRSAGRSRGEVPGEAVEHLGGARVRWQAVLWPGRIVGMSEVDSLMKSAGPRERGLPRRAVD
jgi:hypothetical protein